MIDAILKKYAQELGLRIEKGIAYGIYGRYMVTFKNVQNGFKCITFAAVGDAEANTRLRDALENSEMKKKYNINTSFLSASDVAVTFYNGVGIKNKIREALPYLAQLLSDCGMRGEECCSHCGQPFDTLRQPRAVLLNETVYLMHDDCVGQITETAVSDARAKLAEGNSVTGAIGAFLGGLIGSIPWAVAYYFGWFAAIFGLLIGLASKKGYELLKGRETRAKAVIILLATIVSVALSNYLTLVFSVFMNAPPEYGYTLADIFRITTNALLTDPEVYGPMILDFILGLVFALLGIWGTVKAIFKSNDAKNSLPVVLG